MFSQSGKDESGNRVFEILLVDDDEISRELASNALGKAKEFECNIVTASDGKEAMKILDNQCFDAVISDYRMPGMDGIELLAQVKKIYPKTLRILVTAYSEIKVAKDAINKAEVHTYIEKPWDNDVLRSTIHEALQRKMERESETVTKTDNVTEALRLIGAAQAELSAKRGASSVGRNIMMLEFPNASEFNMFSSQVKQMDNVIIEDVQMFHNKYTVTVRFYPRSYQMIK